VTPRLTKYIIRKSLHRLHPHVRVRDINAYCGKRCEEADVRPLELYTSLDHALDDARKLHKVEPCGWDVYVVGSKPPDIIASVGVKEKAT
jgi:hypothetical protein